MSAAVDILRTKGIQRQNTSRYAPIHNKANLNHTFTAKEVLCFLQLEGLVEVTKTIDIVSDPDIESIVKSSGFTRSRVEDKMVETAFEVLAPGLPKIPPNNVVKMLEFSKAKKLGAAYKIASKVSWSTLKNDLNEKRAEILEVYRRLLSGGDMAEYAVDHVQATGHSFPATFAHRMKVDATPLCQPRNSMPHPKFTFPTQPMESRSPSTTSKDRREENVSPREEARESSGQRAYRKGEVRQTNVPCYVTTRRKKGFRRREVQQNALENVSSKDGKRSKRHSARTRSSLRSNGTALAADGNARQLEGSASRPAKSKYRECETTSVLTDTLDALQLARSPENPPEPEAFGFSDEDWVDETSSAIQSRSLAEDSVASGPVESPTTITLRKLAELREQIIEEKRTGVWYQRQRRRHDFMDSPDSDYTFSDACRSPRPRQQCTFAFRGFRVEAPAAAERPSRQRHPAWYVREDSGSPTPMRAVGAAVRTR